jgi:exopolysaccharide biosynthesis polyprenyl glycosylphosphotransferase
MNLDSTSVRPKHPSQSSPGRGAPEDKLDLLDELYRKYAWGGTRFARLQNHIYFIHKKYGWLIVTKSAHFLKRTLDIIISALLLIALSPLFLVTALAIKLDNPGPVFYSQSRVGKWGNLFKMYKFRSMIVTADKIKATIMSQNESGGVIFKMKRDPRITRVGRIIRKLSIDELPQLLNVLIGDMSLVGPRPPLQNEVEQYEYSDRRRLEVTPGITCIWQVSGRSNLDFKQQVSLDLEYIESQSFWQDIKILLKTIPAVLLGKGAY